MYDYRLTKAYRKKKFFRSLGEISYADFAARTLYLSITYSILFLANKNKLMGKPMGTQVSWLTKARKLRPHWFLSPQASSLANRIIHAVFHGHDFLNWHAFEDWHFHLDADPEERIDTKYQEGDAGDQPDHHALGRIGGDVQYHVYSSRNADARE